MQAVDGYLTFWAVNNGFIEVNPIYRLVAGDWYAPLLYKILPTALAVIGLSLLVKHYPSTNFALATGLVMAIGFYLYITVSNISEIV